MNANSIRELKKSQNLFDSLHANKSTEFKQKITQLEEAIKKETYERINLVLEQQIHLLFQLDDVKSELLSKLDELKEKTNSTLTLDELNDLLNEIKRIECNYEFESSSVGLNIGKLVNKPAPLNNETSLTNKSNPECNMYIYRPPRSKKPAKLTHFKTESFKLPVDIKIWRSIKNNRKHFYFRKDDLNISQLNECNRIKAIIKREVLARFGFDLGLDHDCKLMEGYRFSGRCRKYDNGKCRTYISSGVNASNSICTVKLYIRCDHTNLEIN